MRVIVQCTHSVPGNPKNRRCTGYSIVTESELCVYCCGTGTTHALEPRNYYLKINIILNKTSRYPGILTGYCTGAPVLHLRIIIFQ